MGKPKKTKKEKEQEKEEPKLKSFLISAGNSNGPPDGGVIGFCVRVKAFTKEEAIQKVKDAIPWEMEATKDWIDREEHPDIEYFNVYLHPDGLTVEDISDGETEDAEEDDEEGNDEEE